MNFELQLEGFIKGAQKVIDDDYVKQGYAPRQGKVLRLERGSKYIRVVALNVHDGVANESGSAWAFIEIATGSIYKPASFKAPAKHARGTIMEDGFGVKYISVYGPAYLR